VTGRPPVAVRAAGLSFGGRLLLSFKLRDGDRGHTLFLVLDSQPGCVEVSDNLMQQLNNP
jgi:hypothetical protein